jgi:hypothetical protein
MGMLSLKTRNDLGFTLVLGSSWHCKEKEEIRIKKAVCKLSINKAKSSWFWGWELKAMRVLRWRFRALKFATHLLRCLLQTFLKVNYPRFFELGDFSLFPKKKKKKKLIDHQCGTCANDVPASLCNQTSMSCSLAQMCIRSASLLEMEKCHNFQMLEMSITYGQTKKKRR